MLNELVEIKELSSGNKGLMAKGNMPKGTLIWKLDSNEKQLSKEERDALPEDVRKLAFQYNDKFVVVHDGSQFMNHSCSPNTWWTADNELSALKDISIGEEITYDYSTADIGDWIAPWECHCGSHDCRKTISGKDILNKKLQDKYQGHLPSWTKDYINRYKANRLYILCGIPFSGKTTLAKKIVEKIGFSRIDLDEVKFSLFGKDITDSQIDQSGWDSVYQEMYRQIKQALSNGETVVHDTGNFTKHERDLVKKIADELNIESTTIFVNIPKPEAYKRLLDNRKTNIRFNVTDEDFESTVKEMEPPDQSENHLVFIWTDSVDHWIERNLGF